MTGLRLLRTLSIALTALFLAGSGTSSSRAEGPQLSHVVAFTLKDHSERSREAFVASCKHYLSGHEGTASLAIGIIAQDVVEPPSDRDFDVVLHLVFANKAAAERYQKSPRHREFVEVNKDRWSKVRVFDSFLSTP